MPQNDNERYTMSVLLTLLSVCVTGAIFGLGYIVIKFLSTYGI